MNVAPGGWKYAIPPLLAAPFAFIFSATLSIVALAAGVATLAFFRDPDRTPPPTGVVSPADGTVSVLRQEGDRVRLGVFMNVWHVHVVRAPFDARVTDVEHLSGANRPAFSKESDRNERVHVRCDLESSILPGTEADADAGGLEDSGTEREESTTGSDAADSTAADPHSRADEPASDATVTLIAGAFARRIHPYVEAGDDVDRGDRIGHIAFGSRVDLLFPPAVSLEDVAVAEGESMTAGETVVLETSAAGLDLEGGVDPDVDREDERGEEFHA